MAELGELTIGISLEAILQKELINVVESIQKEHEVVIHGLDFDWERVDGCFKVYSCDLKTTYFPPSEEA